ncbi:proline-rich receptor-like protein kinase PERK9 [Arachis stenosperma]|uniref:proline-rich receptor-like protein kinase PERK9 n=1 Tax=Arachis stenosperma TaxID=217475 RepID=UPI0025AD6BC3|nr:proline-rich receptor-like protein kinase PERK9 [Arachis stenosperma]
MSRRETNPHFSRPPPRGHPEDHRQSPILFVPASEHHGQYPPPAHGVAPTQQEDPPYHPHFPLQPRPQEHPYPLRPQTQGPPPPPPTSKAPTRDKRSKPQQQPPPPPESGRRKRQEGLAYPPSKQKVKISEPSSSKPPVVTPVLPPLSLSPEPRQQLREPHSPKQKQRHDGPRHHRPPWLPPPKKSNPLTWCGAVLCVIFWLIIIIGGLIVLIVYLVFRPQSPHFDISGVTLNAAYLDFGYMLNADITILANFTNPNKKVHVDFSTVSIYLYYGNTLIATQYVEPFSAARAQSRFAYIHMVTSQVKLPLGESQRIVKQMESNGVLLSVRGVFRARSKLGSILRYSYNLYGLCNLMVTRPPDGVLLKKKCRTKR